MATIQSLVLSSKLLEMDDALLTKLMMNTTTEEKDPREDLLQNDHFVKCAAVLWTTYETQQEKSKALLRKRDSLLAELLDLWRQSNDDSTTKEVIYLDCNGLLQLLAGYVEGYQAADAVEHRLRTTLRGLYDKAIEAKLMASDNGDKNVFECPSQLYHCSCFFEQI